MGLDEGIFSGAMHMNVLLDIQRDVKHLIIKFDNIQKSVNDPKKDNMRLKKQNEHLTQKVSDFSPRLLNLNVLRNKNDCDMKNWKHSHAGKI